MRRCRGDLPRAGLFGLFGVFLSCLSADPWESRYSVVPFLAVASLPSVVSVFSVVVPFLTRIRERLALFNSPPRECCETPLGYRWVSRRLPRVRCATLG